MPQVYTLGITPMPKGSLMLPFAPKFRLQQPGEPPVAEEPGCAQKSWPVNLFFDEDGDFLEETFEASVREFVLAYETSVASAKKTN